MALLRVRRRKKPAVKRRKDESIVTAGQYAAQAIHELADAIQEAVAAMWEAAEPTMRELQKSGLLDDNFQLTEKGKALVKDSKK